MPNLSNHYYEFGRFRLDIRERLLLCDGQPVPLTPKAFNVLAVLVRNSGSLVEKDELLSEVWPDTIVEESSLSQKIYQLRKILDDGSGEDKYIQTVPRHGYRFVAEVREVKPLPLDARPAVSVQEVEIEYTCSHILVEQEISDEPTQPEDHSQTLLPAIIRAYSSRFSRTHVIGAAVLLLLLTTAAVLIVRRYRRQPAPMPQRIAVLPFKQLGDDHGNENLGLGVADALIGKLSGLSATDQIKVLPMSAVFKFNGKDFDSLAAGRSLGVDAVLDGTIQRLDDRVRVTAELTNLSDNRVVWSGQYDTKFSDIFVLQDAISIQLAESLKPELTRSEKQLLTKRETLNTDAYEAYVTGIYFSQSRTKEGIAKAIQYFQEAVEKDPSYAKAYAGLANCYMLSATYNYNIVPNNEASQREAAMAKKSLELDPDLAEAHIANAVVLARRGQNQDANQEYQRALQLDPRSSLAHQRYGLFLFLSLQLDEAVQHMRIAQELDPTSPPLNASLGSMLLMQRDYSGAARYSERALELDDDAPARMTLGEVYEQTGKYDLAINEYERAAPQNGRASRFGVAHAWAMLGDRDKAKQLLKQLANAKDASPSDNYNLALIHVALGDNSKALAILQTTELTPLVLAFLKYDPQLDPLRGDPRFAELLRARHLDERFVQLASLKPN